MEKQKQKPDDPKQSERFVEDAQKLELDESGKSFVKTFKKIVPLRKAVTRKQKNDRAN